MLDSATRRALASRQLQRGGHYTARRRVLTVLHGDLGAVGERAPIRRDEAKDARRRMGVRGEVKLADEEHRVRGARRELVRVVVQCDRLDRGDRLAPAVLTRRRVDRARGEEGARERRDAR